MRTSEISGIADALDRVRERIASACARAGRETASVTLVAVSKTVASQRILEALSLGQRVFGENRVQEALAKMPEVPGEAEWHFVGHLQRNKARHSAGRFSLVHSVDGAELAREIDRRAAAIGVVQPVLIQLNLSAEATKHGLAEHGLGRLLELALGLAHLEVRGLMTIPPPVDLPEQNRRWFAQLRELRDDCAERFGRELPELSMGMTDDFEVAIEEGATLVRVGRAIFGERSNAA